MATGAIQVSWDDPAGVTCGCEFAAGRPPVVVPRRKRVPFQLALWQPAFVSAKLPAVVDLVPHRPPMVLLDEVVEHTPKEITCRVRLRPDMPFMHAGKQRCVVCMEYMAQACAAFAGMPKQSEGSRPAIGYVVGVRRMTLARDYLAAGAELTVTACMTWRDVQTAAFRCEVLCGTESVARAELTVVDPTAV